MVCVHSPLFHVPEVDVDVIMCLEFKGDLLYCMQKSYRIVVVLNGLKGDKTSYIGLEGFYAQSHGEGKKLPNVGVQLILLLYTYIDFLFPDPDLSLGRSALIIIGWNIHNRF